MTTKHDPGEEILREREEIANAILTLAQPEDGTPIRALGNALLKAAAQLARDPQVRREKLKA